MSLTPRSRLIIDSARSPRTAAAETANPKSGAPPRRHVEQQAQQQRAADRRGDHEPAKPSHDFFGLIAGAIGCLPKKTPADVPAGVGEHHRRERDHDAQSAVVGGGQQRREPGEERYVDGDQRGRPDIPLVAVRAVAQPPDHGGQHGDDQAERQRRPARPTRPGRP